MYNVFTMFTLYVHFMLNAYARKYRNMPPQDMKQRPLNDNPNFWSLPSQEWATPPRIRRYSDVRFVGGRPSFQGGLCSVSRPTWGWWSCYRWSNYEGNSRRGTCNVSGVLSRPSEWNEVLLFVFGVVSRPSKWNVALLFVSGVPSTMNYESMKYQTLAGSTVSSVKRTTVRDTLTFTIDQERPVTTTL